MEKQFKYVFDNKEVSKEQFKVLAGDSFKWFSSDSSINAVDFDSVSKFFGGEYKSNNEIDKHFKGVLEGHNKNEFYITPPSKSVIDKMCDSFLDRVKNDSDKCGIIDKKVGIKESQSTEKAPVFTYCKVNKNALEALSLRALYGHKKYNINGADDDWQNFTRVPNAEEEYANAQFRHALEIGGEETEKEHLISSAWNAISRLEIYLRNNLK